MSFSPPYSGERGWGEGASFRRLCPLSPEYGGEGSFWGGSLENVGVSRVPARGNANIRKAKQSFDGRPFAKVVAFEAMADPLQQIADDDRCQAPRPRKKQQGDADDSHWNADQMQNEIDRQLMPQPPAV